MRALPLAAGVLALVVIAWQVPVIGTAPTSVWLPFLAIGIAVVLLAISQFRHGG